jgi:hypothetical protein
MDRATAYLHRQINEALAFAAAGEDLRACGKRPAQVLTDRRMQLLYEAAYIQMFLAWEGFLEDSFLRCLCGRLRLTTPSRLIGPRFLTIDQAKDSVLGDSLFFPWSDPSRLRKVSKQFVVGGPHFDVVDSSYSRLVLLIAVRNRIAHRSSYSEIRFNNATMTLCGKRYPQGRPGTFLRDWDSNTAIPRRWIGSIGLELKNLALQIAS